jgi:hypothetical protein
MSGEDYFMRMIAQLSMVIAHVTGLKRAKRYDEGQQVLNDALSQTLGLSSNTVEILSYSELIQLISRGTKIDTDRCLALAKIMKHKADLYEAQQENGTAFNLYLKSLNLYIEALLANDELRTSENIQDIDGIIQIVKSAILPDASKLLIFKYYEMVRRFDKAENTLFNLLDANDYDIDTVKCGLAFYERLFSKEESELLEGNLPATEVREGYEELCKYLI